MRAQLRYEQFNHSETIPQLFLCAKAEACIRITSVLLPPSKKGDINTLLSSSDLGDGSHSETTGFIHQRKLPLS